VTTSRPTHYLFMKLEDALLCLVIRESAVPAAGQGPDFCRRAVAGGVDLIQWTVGAGGETAPEELGSIRDVCREEGALLVLDGDPAVAVEADADGAHMSGGDTSIGYVRSVLGEGRLIGLSSRSTDEAVMALDLEPDYLLHYEGTSSAAALSGLHAGQTVLYAAGIETKEQAGALIESGVYRLAVDWGGSPAGDVQKKMAELSELLGRCL